MNDIQVFNGPDFSVRTIGDNGEIWFVAKDIAEALEYKENSNPSRLVQSVPEMWKGVKRIHTLGGEQELLCLSEQGVYFFLGRSDKKKALPYQMWIAGDVVPSIRKTGNYSVKQMSNEEIQFRLKELEARNRELDMRGAEIIQRMLDKPPFPITPETQTIFAHEVFRLSSGHDCLAMLPESTEKWYTATEIGEELGLSANKIGRIAKAHNLKAPEGESNEYGRWIFSKSRYSSREIPSFIYNENALDWFKKHQNN